MPHLVTGLCVVLQHSLMHFSRAEFKYQKQPMDRCGAGCRGGKAAMFYLFKRIVQDKEKKKFASPFAIRNSTTLVHGLGLVLQLIPSKVNWAELQYQTQPINKPTGLSCNTRHNPCTEGQCFWKSRLFFSHFNLC